MGIYKVLKYVNIGHINLRGKNMLILDFPMDSSSLVYIELLEVWERGWTKLKFNLWLVEHTF